MRSPITEAASAIPGFEEAFAREQPLGHIGTADDVAEAALLLASASDACFITGEALHASGGLRRRRAPTRAEALGA